MFDRGTAGAAGLSSLNSMPRREAAALREYRPMLKGQQ